VVLGGITLGLKKNEQPDSSIKIDLFGRNLLCLN
jgi:hypothetical protein